MHDTEDAEKANMRRQIEQLEQAAAAQAQLQYSHSAEQSGVTDDERLEAALHQQHLQARIDQLEVGMYVTCKHHWLMQPCLWGQ